MVALLFAGVIGVFIEMNELLTQNMK